MLRSSSMRTALIIAGNSAAMALAPVVAGRPLAHWNRSPELQAAVEQAIANGRPASLPRAPVHARRAFARRDGDAAAGGEGAPMILLVICRDLTEQESLTRMRADFVANASHELRTPLASLRGFVETLQGAAKA